MNNFEAKNLIDLSTAVQSKMSSGAKKYQRRPRLKSPIPFRLQEREGKIKRLCSKLSNKGKSVKKGLCKCVNLIYIKYQVQYQENYFVAKEKLLRIQLEQENK